jgi:hypothetical protein
MSDADAVAELGVALLTAKAEIKYWRERCAVYEAHHAKLEAAAADVRGRVEQFLIVLGHARPQGTDRRAVTSEQRAAAGEP